MPVLNCNTWRMHRDVKPQNLFVFSAQGQVDSSRRSATVKV